MKRRLKLDLDDPAFAFEDASTEAANYLDLDTGEVVRVSDEIQQELERLYEELNGVEDEDQSAFATALQCRALPDWMKEAIQEADQVEAGYGSRYVRVPTLESSEGYQIMADFIPTVGDRRLQGLLELAIRGRGAFRRFKDVLAEYPRERERWFAFHDARLRELALRWLELEEIEPIAE